MKFLLVAEEGDTEVVDVMTEAHDVTLQTTADNETQPEVVPPEVSTVDQVGRGGLILDLPMISWVCHSYSLYHLNTVVLM